MKATKKYLERICYGWIVKCNEYKKDNKNRYTCACCLLLKEYFNDVPVYMNKVLRYRNILLNVEVLRDDLIDKVMIDFNRKSNNELWSVSIM